MSNNKRFIGGDKRVHTKIISFFSILFVFFLCLLAREYFLVKRQQEQLRTIKREYQKYVTHYKQAIEKYMQDQPVQAPVTTAVASGNDFLKDFLIVNRGLGYLRHEAIQHSKQEQLAPNVEQLYESESYLPRKNEPKASPGRIKLAWPIDRERFWISSKFGPRRKKGGAMGFHHGIDMAALKGTLVKAPLKGTVLQAGFSTKGYGNSIIIHHAQEKIMTRYAHLDSILVKVGDSLKAGDSIGRVGNTGFVRGMNGDHSNATHLHFEVIVAGKKRIDPLLLLT